MLRLYSTALLFLLCIVSVQSAPLSKAEQQALFASCAPEVGGRTLAAIVSVESSGNPYAVAIVGSPAVAQPSSLPDALALVRKLDAAGANYSAGLMQVNARNFSRFGLSAASAFDPCRNIAAGAAILSDCYRRAPSLDAQSSLRAALSCYYAGNFTHGFKQEASGSSYVGRIERAAFRGNGVLGAASVPASTFKPQLAPRSRGWDVFDDFE